MNLSELITKKTVYQPTGYVTKNGVQYVLDSINDDGEFYNVIPIINGFTCNPVEVPKNSDIGMGLLKETEIDVASEQWMDYLTHFENKKFYNINDKNYLFWDNNFIELGNAYGTIEEYVHTLKEIIEECITAEMDSIPVEEFVIFHSNEEFNPEIEIPVFNSEFMESYHKLNDNLLIALKCSGNDIEGMYCDVFHRNNPFSDEWIETGFSVSVTYDDFNHKTGGDLYSNIYAYDVIKWDISQIKSGLIISTEMNPQVEWVPGNVSNKEYLLFGIESVDDKDKDVIYYIDLSKDNFEIKKLQSLNQMKLMRMTKANLLQKEVNK